MGLQNHLSDVSSESTVILAAVVLAKTLGYLRSLLLRSLAALFSSPNNHPHLTNSPHDVVGARLAGLVLLCEQLNLNRSSSYPNRDVPAYDCVVCLDQMGDGDHVRELACRHVFHKECFDGWLEHLNFDCPLCRTPLVATTGSTVYGCAWPETSLPGSASSDAPSWMLNTSTK